MARLVVVDVDRVAHHSRLIPCTFHLWVVHPSYRESFMVFIDPGDASLFLVGHVTACDEESVWFVRHGELHILPAHMSWLYIVCPD